jgi:chromosome segregation ATPase
VREAERIEAAVAHKKELDALQNRIIELEREAAAGQYKDELITTLRERLNEDRRDYNERMTFFQTQIEKLQSTNERYVEERVRISRRAGELEAEIRTLRQLPAGKSETPPKEPAPDASTSMRNDEVVYDQPSN